MFADHPVRNKPFYTKKNYGFYNFIEIFPKGNLWFSSKVANFPLVCFRTKWTLKYCSMIIQLENNPY